MRHNSSTDCITSSKPASNNRFVLVALFALCCFLILPSPVHSQQSPPTDVSDIVGSRLQEITSERISGTLDRLRSQEREMASGLRRMVNHDLRKRTLTTPNGQSFSGIARQHPLLANDGAETSGKSKEEYTRRDTEALFNNETVTQCLEDRQVFVEAYINKCAEVCPGPYVRPEPGCPACNPLEPGCVLNKFYVSELYFPIYQSRTYPGRAMGSFDPAGSYLSGSDRRPELKYRATKQRIRRSGLQEFRNTFQEYFDQSPEHFAGNLEDAVPQDLWQLEYAGSDRQPENSIGDPQALHTLVYQTNAHRQATRRRPRLPTAHLGYELENNCFFHTLDNAEKEVIAHATYGEEQYIRLSQRAYETRSVDPEAWRAAAVNQTGPSVFQIARQLDLQHGGGSGSMPSLLQGLAPSQRMQFIPEEFRPGLQRLGITERQHEQDYIFYAIARGPFYTNNYNVWTSPLYAAIAHGWTHYTVNALESFQPNTPLRRPIRFSLYASGPGGSNYTGKYPTIGPEQIFTTDKLQLIFPTAQLGGKRQGSHCFRPESLARSSIVHSQNAIEEKTSTGFNGFRRDLAKLLPEQGIERGLQSANEIRLAYWLKRVNCYCTACGVPYGCQVLHDGDVPEDNFYGTTSLANKSPTLFIGGSGSRASRRISDQQQATSPTAAQTALLNQQGPPQSRRDSLDPPRLHLIGDRKESKHRYGTPRQRRKNRDRSNALSQTTGQGENGTFAGDAIVRSDLPGVVNSTEAIAPGSNTLVTQQIASDAGTPGTTGPGVFPLAASPYPPPGAAPPIFFPTSQFPPLICPAFSPGGSCPSCSASRRNTLLAKADPLRAAN